MKPPHPAPVAEIESGAWQSGIPPAISVVVPTHNRAAFLPELEAALRGQSVGPAGFEAIFVDDDSTDDTWNVLNEIAAASPLRLRAIRLRPNRGPAETRNAGTAAARAPIVAFTDDDCLPTPGWLEAILSSCDRDIDIVQGRTNPDPEEFGRAGPWDRTVWVTELTSLFETCNIAYRREVFASAGGFAQARPATVSETRHHFGEDAELGWRLVESGARVRFASEAIVHHRMLPSDFAGWLREQRRLVLFPGLVRRHPGLAKTLRVRVFLAPHTAAFDLAALSLVGAVAARTPWLLLGWVPWIRIRWAPARRRRGRPVLVRLAQLALGDGVGLASLLGGSVRSGRLVL